MDLYIIYPNFFGEYLNTNIDIYIYIYIYIYKHLEL